jgi:sulfite reductase beta subunit-like hemoprotein
MACPALPTCGLALAESERVMPQVLERLEALLGEVGLAGESLGIRVTGCPNGCARPYTAELALVGRSPGKYAVFAGGNAAGTRLAAPVADLVPFETFTETVRPLLVRWRDERMRGEGFGDFVMRAGLVTPPSPSVAP